MFVFAEDARGTQYSQELRLNYDNGGKVSWFGGVSYFDEDAQTRVPLQFDERYALALLTGQLTKPNPQPTALLTNTTYPGGPGHRPDRRRGQRRDRPGHRQQSGRPHRAVHQLRHDQVVGRLWRRHLACDRPLRAVGRPALHQ
jgi:hypothetical protein